MEEAALFAVWIVGLTVLVGGAMAAITRFVTRDTSAYDEHTTWAHLARRENRQPEEPSGDLQEERPAQLDR
ncbi:hypothetical protein [Cohnella hongkongensis]|uniref:YtzI protein n=1 Tax=Cohnella hongkongensis TaxID=178337 RepID=A0ABV9FNG2_9BACL